MRVPVEQILIEQAVIRLVGKIHEALIHQKGGFPLPGPVNQAQKAGLRDVVSAWVVRIDQNQVLHRMRGEERHHVVLGIGEIRVFRAELDLIRITVTVFLKARADDPDLAGKTLHEGLDQLRGPVSDQNAALRQAEVLGRQQGIDVHPGGILRQQRLKAGLDLVAHPLGREVGVDQIAEVQHARIAPIAAVAGLELCRAIRYAVGEDGFRNVKILHVVNLVPPLTRQPLGPDRGVVEHRDDAQHLLIVFVFSQCLDVSLQEGNVLVLRKLPAEPVDIDGLVVACDLVVAKALLGNEGSDPVVLVEQGAGPVHPALILVYQGQIRPGVVQQKIQHGILKDQIGFEQNRVLGAEVFFRQRQRIDVVGPVEDRIVNEFDRRGDGQTADVSLELFTLIADH